MSATRHKLVPDVAMVVGSHGGLRAAQRMLGRLPGGFPAALVLDLHRNENGQLPQILARRTDLPLLEAAEGLPFERGRVYLAPADRALMMSDSGFVGMAGHRGGQSWVRVVDMLMSLAAQTFGERLIAIVLSGQLDAGALGVRAVKTHGGRVLVQDPASALARSMPCAALDTGCVDFALPPESLGDALVALCAAPGAAELFRVGSCILSKPDSRALDGVAH